jgi:S-methyl-5-thioribose-1-phosphate isomerase
MKVNNINYRTVWMEGDTVYMIDQNILPFDFFIYTAKAYKDTCYAISTMIIRGAGAIGAAAGFAMAQAFLQAPKGKPGEFVKKARSDIESTRPTARNLFYATERVFNAGTGSAEAAVIEAQQIADEDAQDSKNIGKYGNELIKDGYAIETHCNAGWLAFVDHGTALSPIYSAHQSGKKVFVYVDETRPRNQGAKLTAWELKNEGIPHVIIPDNAGACLMSAGKIDLVIVGADRIAANGDTANKIGTLEKAVVAKNYNIPFYVAAPTTTFDLKCSDGSEIIIEQRDKEEVLYQTGMNEEGEIQTVMVSSPGSEALNLAFDVTPAEYITGIITEKGIISPDPGAIKKIYNA